MTPSTPSSPYIAKTRIGKIEWVRDVRSKGQYMTAITISEANRATEWCKTKADVEILTRILNQNYLAKNVNAILAAVTKTNPSTDKRHTEYAVFVQSGFLTDISEAE